jgi:hypothetical protein
MAAPPFGTYTAPVWSAMFLVLSFLSFFLWKKALWRPGQEEKLTDFSTLKTGLVQPSNCIIYYEA